MLSRVSSYSETPGNCRRGHALAGKLRDGVRVAVGLWLGSSDGLWLPGMQGRGGSRTTSPGQRVIYLGAGGGWRTGWEQGRFPHGL